MILVEELKLKNEKKHGSPRTLTPPGCVKQIGINGFLDGWRNGVHGTDHRLMSIIDRHAGYF
jgi:hypothetical protein